MDSRIVRWFPGSDDILDELAERGLRHYTARIADAVGTGPESAWWEWADAPSAYIALDRRLSAHPDRDAALIWSAERGWALAVETGCGEDLLIAAALGGDVLPAPETVAKWANAVLADRRGDVRVPPGRDVELSRRLADWAWYEPTSGGDSSRRHDRGRAAFDGVPTKSLRGQRASARR